MKYKFALIFLFFLTSGFLNGQESTLDSTQASMEGKPDTLQCQIYADAFRDVFEIDLDEAKKYADLCLKSAIRSENKYYVAQANNLLGIHQLYVSKFEEALDYFEKTKDLYLEIDRPTMALRPMNNMAVVLDKMGEIDQSLKIHLDILKLLEEEKIEGDQLASSYWNIASIKQSLSKNEEAIKWYKRAYIIYAELGDTLSQTDINFNIGLCQLNLRRLTEAEVIFKNCIEYYQRAGMKVAEAESLDNLGEIYIYKKNYTEANASLLRALNLASEHQGGHLVGQIYRRLNMLYLETNELKKAEKYGLLSLQNAKEYGRDKKIINDYLQLSIVYEKQGKLGLALSNYKNYFAHNDSIFGLEKLNAINEVQLEYEAFKREQEARLYEAEAKQAALEKKGLIAGILGLFGLLCALVYGFRQRMAKNKLAKAKIDLELQHSKAKLEQKKKELTAYALQLAHKNEVLEGIKEDVSSIKESNQQDLQKIVRTIDFNQNDDESWIGFRRRFQAVHKNFESNIKHNFPTITSNELRLMSLLKMTLSSKEIANILNISPDGVKKARHRLRKKLELDPTDSLEDFVLTL
jgi:tetratricopeptide (TPR) repeat protein